MGLRLALQSDLARIVEISNLAAEHTVANFATAPESVEDGLAQWKETSARYPWLVVCADGQVEGFAKASPHRGRCAYANTADVSVYLAPSRHRQGLGTALYQRLIPGLELRPVAEVF